MKLRPILVLPVLPSLFAACGNVLVPERGTGGTGGHGGGNQGTTTSQGSTGGANGTGGHGGSQGTTASQGSTGGAGGQACTEGYCSKVWIGMSCPDAGPDAGPLTVCAGGLCILTVIDCAPASATPCASDSDCPPKEVCGGECPSGAPFCAHSMCVAGQCEVVVPLDYYEC